MFISPWLYEAMNGLIYNFTDNPLKNIKEVQETLSSIDNLTHIFVGHYHCQFDLNIGRQEVHVAPSTQMQIDPEKPYFNLQSSSPGWRTIEWGEDYVETSIYFKKTP